MLFNSLYIVRLNVAKDIVSKSIELLRCNKLCCLYD